jgi:NADH:ubiquinone oxidoreductase subunit E
VDDDVARQRFEQAWECTLNGKPGLTFAEMAQDLWGDGEGSEKRIRFLYSVGQNVTISTPDIPKIGKTMAAVDFLVVQDILDNENLQYADVVLPAATWAEDDGTYTNCERRVSRMRRAISCNGQAKPEIWIFTQLARRLGLDWPERSSQQIWEEEIAALVPQFRGITYERIETGGLQWPVPDLTSEGTPFLRGDTVPLCRAPSISFNYHHFALLEQCEGLLESLPRSGGIGLQVSPSNPREVWEKFFSFLEEEKKPEVKPRIDTILAEYRAKRGGLIPVLQNVQEILGFLPIPVQNYIAQGLRIPPAEVFGVVSFYSFFTMVPRGRHIIRLCLGTACFVKGSAKLLEKIQHHLKVSIGETTEDREFSLDVVRCLGACGLAPVMVVDDVTHGQMDASRIVEIVESFRGASDVD